MWTVIKTGWIQDIGDLRELVEKGLAFPSEIAELEKAMSKQWGHGFHTGVEKGHEEGYERGMAVPALMEAEQLNVLISSMAVLFAKHGAGSDQWALLRTMSEVNAKNMLTEERAWHLEESKKN